MATEAFSAEFEKSVYSRVTWRLIPFLFLLYVLAYLDRVNVGFAKLKMLDDLGFSEAIYGFGAGIFFLGYFFFEVPSNLLMQRFGARVWIARIMITWGVISSAMMFTNSVATFYALRFLLGMAEAGFFPGIILYLTYWYPSSHRAKMVAAFMTAIALAGVFGSPMSGWILSTMNGMAGLKGWQWVFLIEGIPSVIVGLAVLKYLSDGPRDAKWLGDKEKELLLARLAQDELNKQAKGEHRSTLREAFSSSKVWLLCPTYFGIIMGLYGVSFWLPQIVKDTITKDEWRIGLICMIPWGFAAAAMVINASHSDRTGERRWHIAGSCFVAAVAFAMCALPQFQNAYGIIPLAFATAGVMCSISVFWSMPTAILAGTAAAAGIAWINSIGNLAGHVSPMFVGMIKVATGGSMTWGLIMLGGSMLLAGILTIVITGMKAQISRQGPQDAPAIAQSADRPS